jgi:serine acetyltransferase
MAGAGAKILGAITVGDRCTVGANSVVTKEVREGAMWSFVVILV